MREVRAPPGPVVTRTPAMALRPFVRALLLALLALLTLHSSHAQKWKRDFGPCYRNCSKDPYPKLCHYEFTEEIFAVLTAGSCKNCSAGTQSDCYSEQCVAADGVEKTIYTINRQMPGPALYVCRGDVIQVDLSMELVGHAEAIHWHGLPQRLTPYYDGVAWVTQCPVLFGNTFRYEFLAEPAGTYFYHSHSGLHKVDGILGPMVIRTPSWEDPHRALYDEDLPQHTMMLQDWMHVPAEFVSPGLASRLTGQPSNSLLINGQGRFTSLAADVTTNTPLATFEVEPGKRYRFRVINAASLSCPIQLQFEGHDMTVISADGLDIQPVKANTLVTFSGERWDVVVQAKRRSTTRAFWIYIQTVGFCSTIGASEQLGVLVYKGGSNITTTPPTAAPGLLSGRRQLAQGTVVNVPGDCDGAEQVCAAELSSLVEDDGLCTETQPVSDPQLVFFGLRFAVLPPSELFAKDNYQPFLAFGSVNLNAVLNNITYSPASAPFLTQPGDASFCNEDQRPEECAGKDLCVCPHLVKVASGSYVDVVVVDDSDISAGDNSSTLLAHPMHLHGYSFAVMGEGTLRNITSGYMRAAAVRRLYDQGRLSTYVKYPALKDVMALPGGGYIWFRFFADNPGCWLFHCHFQYHMAGGMEVVLQVGESDKFVKPPVGFPTCGNYVPSG